MPVSRRELLTLALGAPLAAACTSSGCTRSSSARVPDGELFDFGRPRGHDLVRDGKAPLLGADVPVRRAGVAVVGGGVAGLAAAWRLRRAGVDDVLVLELDDTLGGTSQSGRSAVTAFPWGAHYVVAPFSDNRVFTTLLDELGAFEGRDARGHPVVREELGCREPEERHFYRGAFHDGLYPLAGESPEEGAQLRQFQKDITELAAGRGSDGRRAFTLPAAACSQDERFTALDGQSFAAWLDARGYTSWRLRWLCDYACRDDYGLALEDTSAWAGLFYFCSRRRPSDDGGRAGGDDGGGGVAGPGGSVDRPVLTWPEGNGRIVAHLAAGLGERALRGAVVVDIDPGAAPVALTVTGPAGPLRVLADDVVVAAPRFVAARLLRPWRATPPGWLGAFTTSAWAVVNLHLDGRPRSPGFPFAWDTVFTESRSLGYVTATHQSGRDHGPTVLTWYRPLVEGAPAEARQRLLDVDRAGWAEAALSELELGHRDIRDRVTRVDVGRFGHAMVRPVPGLRSGGALDDAQAAVGRVSFAHTDLSGLPLCEEALFHGVRAAEEVLARRGEKTESLL